jgi:hypothetical protein
MALQEQLNTVECGASGLIGSGRLGCPIDPENIKHLYALQAGTKITGTLDRAAIRTLQKDGKLVPLLDAYDVTWSSEENQVETSASLGVKSKSRSGLYELTAMFANGIYFQKVLKSMEGQGRWDIILVDDAENLFGSTGRNDEFKGFKVGMFAVNPYTFKSGSDSGKTSITIQFTRSSEFNQDVAYIAAESLDFMPSDIDGVNQVRLDLSGLANASTSIVAKVVLDKDNKTYIGGLALSEFLVKVNGATITPSGVTEDAANKQYTFTVAALNTDDSVEVSLYDSGNNKGIIEVGTAPDEVLYQSKTATGIVAA